MARGRIALLLVATIAAGWPAAASPWAEIGGPSPGPTRIVGGAANGCLAGAAALPEIGAGFQALRPARLRNFGHPTAIDYVQRLGAAVAAAGHAPLLIGDVAQPRGGPMPSGHGSHQTGLDIDIWFERGFARRLTAEERDNPTPLSLVKADQSAVEPRRFAPAHVEILRLAARDDAVDRVFVHWTIKRALCEGANGARARDASWLRRIRPWWGHDHHFHVRLSCPDGSPDCVRQPPVPAGEGCDASLDWWFAQKTTPTLRPPAPPPPKVLPQACAAVLKE